LSEIQGERDREELRRTKKSKRGNVTERAK